MVVCSFWGIGSFYLRWQIYVHRVVGISLYYHFLCPYRYFLFPDIDNLCPFSYQSWQRFINFTDLFKDSDFGLIAHSLFFNIFNFINFACFASKMKTSFLKWSKASKKTFLVYYGRILECWHFLFNISISCYKLPLTTVVTASHKS